MRNQAPDVLGYYRQPGVMTSAGAQAGRLAGLPAEVGGLAGVTHGVLVHEHLAGLYEFEMPDERRDSVHLRPAERLLERISAEDGRPLDMARPAAARVAGNCRHFTVLPVTMLRAQGRRGRGAASAATSRRASSRTTGCASSGTPPGSAGCWPTRSLTPSSETGSGSASTSWTCRGTSS